MAFIQQRIAELEERIPIGGAREAAVRALVYIGMGSAGVDERAFNELRLMRAKHDGISLDEFKALLREQFFSLLLNQDRALAAIPGMLRSEPAQAEKFLSILRSTVQATGEPTGERARRLAHVEQLFSEVVESGNSKRKVTKRPVKTARLN